MACPPDAKPGSARKNEVLPAGKPGPTLKKGVRRGTVPSDAPAKLAPLLPRAKPSASMPKRGSASQRPTAMRPPPNGPKLKWSGESTIVPGTPRRPPVPVVADGLPAAKVVKVGGSGADFTDHSSAPPLTHQLGPATGLGGAFSGRSAALAVA